MRPVCSGEGLEQLCWAENGAREWALGRGDRGAGLVGWGWTAGPWAPALKSACLHRQSVARVFSRLALWKERTPVVFRLR